MCFKQPKPPAPPPLAPAPAPPAPAPAAVPPPQLINGTNSIGGTNSSIDGTNPSIKTKKSKKEDQGALSKGVNSLKVPLRVPVNPGGSGGLNV